MFLALVFFGHFRNRSDDFFRFVHQKSLKPEVKTGFAVYNKH